MSRLFDWQNARLVRLGLALVLGLVLCGGLLLVMGLPHLPGVTQAAGPTIRYVAPAPLGNDSGNDCINSSTPCATVQRAVDVADADDEVRVATGTYTDIHVRPRADVVHTGVVTQVVYISKTLTVRGGYTPADWRLSNPASYPTTLDAGGEGRVIYITGDIKATIEGLDITRGNAAGLGGGIHWGGGDSGGGVYGISATVTLSNSQLFDNFASHGGGLFLLNGADSTLIASTIHQNKAGLGGGAVFDQCPRPILRENTIDHNQATFSGGMELNDSPDAVLVDNTISHNKAPNIGGGMKYFGGVRFTNGDRAKLIGNTISGNYAANYCGGVCFDGGDGVTLIGNTITGNETGVPGYVASQGAGLGLRGSTNLTMIENQIRDNRTNTSGGGLFVVGSSVSLIANEIVHNEAAQGGGLFANFNSVVSLMSTTVLSNTAYGYPGKEIPGIGGGIYLARSRATLTSTVIAGNEAADAASGVYVQEDVSADLVHTTIAYNRGGDDSGLHLAGADSTLSLTNTILVGHGVGITVAAGNTATLQATLWGTGASANLLDWGGAGTILTGTLNLWDDPAFAADGYHLTLASAALDLLTDTLAARDVDGNPRPRDGDCRGGAKADIGAVEYFGCTGLPLMFRDFTP